MSKAVAAAATTITITMLCAQVCLYFGLKYLWNIMNLIQFVIFMQMWLVGLPPTARIFMRELKALALLEFIPYQWLSGDDAQSDKSSAVSEEIGIDRFGTNSLVNGLGSMLIIAMVIGIVILLAIFLRLIAIYSSLIMKLFVMIKTKLQYNSILRYVL